VFFAGFTHGNFETSDEWTVFEATASLWQSGVPAVNPAPYTHRGLDGHLYSQYMLGQSVLAMPFFAVGRLTRHTLPKTWLVAVGGAPTLTHGRSVAGGHPEITAVTFFAPTMVAMLISICFLLQRELDVSRETALLVSVLVGTTSYVAMHAVYFLRHSTTTVFLMAAIVAFQRHRSSGDRTSLFVGASMAAAIPLVRLPDAILGLPLACFVVWIIFEAYQRDGAAAIRRAVPSLAIPGLTALGLYVASNWLRWGSVFDSPILSFSSAFDLPMLHGLAGFLFSPGVSVFLYSPLLLLFPWSAVALARRDRAIFALCLGISLSLLLFFSKWHYWAGLPVAPGPRYLFAIGPLLLISLGPWLDEARSRWPWRAVAGLAVLGAVVQLALLLARWESVQRMLGSAETASTAAPWDWLFDPARSPILVAFRAVSKGDVNNFIFQFSQGWVGFEPRPEFSFVLSCAWLSALAIAVRGLLRSLNESRSD
jgi:hypothetical protein